MGQYREKSAARPTGQPLGASFRDEAGMTLGAMLLGTAVALLFGGRMRMPTFTTHADDGSIEPSSAVTRQMNPSGIAIMAHAHPNGPVEG